MVSRHRELRDEPRKARACESKESVQALTVGMTTLGADRVGPTRHRPIARAWRGSSLALKNEVVYILMNSLLNRIKLMAGLSRDVAASRLV